MSRSCASCGEAGRWGGRRQRPGGARKARRAAPSAHAGRVAHGARAPLRGARRRATRARRGGCARDLRPRPGVGRAWAGSLPRWGPALLRARQQLARAAYSPPIVRRRRRQQRGVDAGRSRKKTTASPGAPVFVWLWAWRSAWASKVASACCCRCLRADARHRASARRWRSCASCGAGAHQSPPARRTAPQRGVSPTPQQVTPAKARATKSWRWRKMPRSRFFGGEQTGAWRRPLSPGAPPRPPKSGACCRGAASSVHPARSRVVTRYNPQVPRAALTTNATAGGVSRRRGPAAPARQPQRPPWSAPRVARCGPQRGNPLRRRWARARCRARAGSKTPWRSALCRHV